MVLRTTCQYFHQNEIFRGRDVNFGVGDSDEFGAIDYLLFKPRRTNSQIKCDA